MRAAFITLVIAAIGLITVSAAPAGDMRCGNDIVNIDDSAFMVAEKCGRPIDKVAVGYTIDEAKKR